MSEKLNKYAESRLETGTTSKLSKRAQQSSQRRTVALDASLGPRRNSLPSLSEISSITSNIYLGSIVAARSYSLREKFNISYIVSTDCCPLPKSITAGLHSYIFINVQDLPRENLLSHFEDTYSFIDKAVSEGQNVLVHCVHGISRSASVVVAYFMKKKRMKLQKALAFVKARRPKINPNAGFLLQLKMYQAMGLELNPSFPPYRQFYVATRAATFYTTGKPSMSVVHDVCGEDPESTNDTAAYCCKRCRRPLVCAQLEFPHVPSESPHWMYVTWVERDWNLDFDKRCKEGIFVTPVSWMQIRNSRTGKLKCPKCDAKVGTFNWGSGCKCPCGGKSAPGFFLRGKAVEMRGSVTAPSFALQKKDEGKLFNAEMEDSSSLNSSNNSEILKQSMCSSRISEGSSDNEYDGSKDTNKKSAQSKRSSKRAMLKKGKTSREEQGVEELVVVGKHLSTSGDSSLFFTRQVGVEDPSVTGSNGDDMGIEAGGLKPTGSGHNTARTFGSLGGKENLLSDPLLKSGKSAENQSKVLERSYVKDDNEDILDSSFSSYRSNGKYSEKERECVVDSSICETFFHTNADLKYLEDTAVGGKPSLDVRMGNNSMGSKELSKVQTPMSLNSYDFNNSDSHQHEKTDSQDVSNSQNAIVYESKNDYASQNSCGELKKQEKERQDPQSSRSLLSLVSNGAKEFREVEGVLDSKSMMVDSSEEKISRDVHDSSHSIMIELQSNEVECREVERRPHSTVMPFESNNENQSREIEDGSLSKVTAFASNEGNKLGEVKTRSLSKQMVLEFNEQKKPTEFEDSLHSKLNVLESNGEKELKEVEFDSRLKPMTLESNEKNRGELEGSQHSKSVALESSQEKKPRETEVGSHLKPVMLESNEDRNLGELVDSPNSEPIALKSNEEKKLRELLDNPNSEPLALGSREEKTLGEILDSPHSKPMLLESSEENKVRELVGSPHSKPMVLESSDEKKLREIVGSPHPKPMVLESSEEKKLREIVGSPHPKPTVLESSEEKKHREFVGSPHPKPMVLESSEEKKHREFVGSPHPEPMVLESSEEKKHREFVGSPHSKPMLLESNEKKLKEVIGSPHSKPTALEPNEKKPKEFEGSLHSKLVTLQSNEDNEFRKIADSPHSNLKTLESNEKKESRKIAGSCHSNLTAIEITAEKKLGEVEVMPHSNPLKFDSDKEMNSRKIEGSLHSKLMTLESNEEKESRDVEGSPYSKLLAYEANEFREVKGRSHSKSMALDSKEEKKFREFESELDSKLTALESNGKELQMPTEGSTHSRVMSGKERTHPASTDSQMSQFEKFDIPQSLQFESEKRLKYSQSSASITKEIEGIPNSSDAVDKESLQHSASSQRKSKNSCVLNEDSLSKEKNGCNQTFEPNQVGISRHSFDESTKGSEERQNSRSNLKLTGLEHVEVNDSGDVLSSQCTPDRFETVKCSPSNVSSATSGGKGFKETMVKENVKQRSLGNHSKVLCESNTGSISSYLDKSLDIQSIKEAFARSHEDDDSDSESSLGTSFHSRLEFYEGIHSPKSAEGEGKPDLL